MEASQESPICEFDDSDKDFEASPGAASLQTSQTSEISTPRLVYDRDFLLQLQYSQLSMQKPEYLPNIPEISPYKPVSTPSKDMRSGAGKYRDLPDFTLGFLRPTRGVSDDQGSATGAKVEQSKSTDHSESSLTQGNSSDRPEEVMKQTIRPTPDTDTHISYHRKFSALPLPQCEIDPERVAQVLTHLKRPDGQRYQVDEIPGPTSPNTEPTQEREEELYRKIRSILNKLTPQKFQTLIKQVQGLVIDTETRLKGVTDIIWEQATSYSAYAPLYADLCKHLLTMKVPSDKNPEERVTLRVVLLLICRKSFTEVISHTSNEEKEKSVEKFFPCDAKRHEKKRVQMKCIGIVRFMGEMFKLKVLTERIILDCIFKLLMPGDEIRLECLCHLLSSVGEILDAKGKIDQYFQQIRTIVSERKVSSRCNFMLQDVIQIRENSWIPYRRLNIPKKIAEIHKEAEKEAEEEAKALAEADIELNSHSSQLNDVDSMDDHLTGMGADGWDGQSDRQYGVIKNLKLDVQLHKAENPWRPGKVKDDKKDKEEIQTEELYRKMRSLLNKLTPQKFQTLIKQVQGLVIDTETRLQGVTHMIFEKAISEPLYSVAYANMCRYLLTLKVPSDTKQGESVNFRVILLTRCQREFEKDKDIQLDLDKRKKATEEESDKKAEMKEELETLNTNTSKRSIGNIRFIGELFKLKMLTETIMHDCVFILLRSRDEENLECLCRLLTTIGKELDSEKAKPRMDQYFKHMKRIVTEKKVSSRCRFMLQDVIDLRDNNWKPRRDENQPKTIDQIHKDAKREAVAQDMMTALYMAPQPQHHQSTVPKFRIEKVFLQPQPPSELSEEEMEKKTLSIIDEYLHIQDRKEAIICVQELNSPKTTHYFVYYAINHVLKRSKQARQHTGHLLHDLINQKVISVDTYLQGLTEILHAAEDMEIDLPKIWLYLGELIGPMIQDGSVPLSFLTKACEPLKATGKAGNLMAEVLHDASQRLGHKIVAHLWRINMMNWTDFVPQEKLQQFLKDKNLEFTVGQDSAPSTPTSKVSIEWISQNLTELLTDPKCDNEKAFDWIEANIPDEITKENKFIRALMSSVCSSAIIGSGNNPRVDPEVIKKWRSLLLKYLDHSPVFELQALFALQALVNSLEHPSGVLRSFFDTLYDEEIISEDAFNQWETSKEEPEGKGVALKQVVQFFAEKGRRRRPTAETRPH